MKASLSAILGTLIGLALAAALLLPDADPRRLAAQGTTALLGEDLAEGFPAGDDASAPALAAEASVFAALHGALGAAQDAAGGAAAAPEDGIAVAVTVAVDGAPAVESAFVRAFGTNLNLYNEQRRARGLPPARLVTDGISTRPEAAARPAAPPPAGAPAAVTVALDVRRQDHEVVLAARITGPAGTVAVAPRDADGAARAWRVPDRGALVPPLLAIMIALLFRRVLVALFLGIWAGAALMAHHDGGGVFGSALGGLWDVFGTYLLREVVDTFRIEIIGFVIFLVAMVGVMSRCGGVQGLVDLLLRFARSVRSTMAVTWGMGLTIFFDDYANCLLVGNTMRPLTDRMRISREKLAYLVDSTAAPIAGLSLLSTWIAFEVSTYSAQLPGAGISDSAYAVFLQTIPYRYYCLFTLLFVGLVVATQRDFGPMLRAETRARTLGQLVRPGGRPTVGEAATRIEPKPGLPLRARDALLPIPCVLLVTFWRIFVDGKGPEAWRDGTLTLGDLPSWQQVLYAGSGAGPIFLGAFFGLLLAAFLCSSSAARLAIAAGFVAAWELSPALASWLSGDAAPGDAVTEAVRGLLPAEPLGWLGAAPAGYVAWGLLFTLVAALVGRAARGLRTVRPHLSWTDVRRAGLSSIRALFFAVLILFSAWMIGRVCTDLKTADYLVALMSDAVPAVLLPVLLFTIASIVAVSTGSSWSTMSILLPNVVALAAAIGAESGIGSITMVVMSIGAVLEGSIFGDHCSPISDTTVLSSVSSASDHVDHVRTQAPYALVTAAMALGIGYLPSILLDGWNVWLALVTAAGAMLALLMLVGRRAPPPEAPIPGGGPPTRPLAAGPAPAP